MISVWKNETLSRTLPVRPDGKISMPLLHDVQAAGLTPMQLRDRLAGSLAEFMPNPEVAVSVTEVRSYRVSVLGEVQRPGLLQLRSNTTILEALAMAGGFRDFASPSKIMIFRQDAKGNTEKIRFNYNRAVSNASEQENLILLKSGDVIVVP
jgi:polysaccharide export outer membrane protein